MNKFNSLIWHLSVFCLHFTEETDTKISSSLGQNRQKHLILASILTHSSSITLENKEIYIGLDLPWGKTHLYK